MKKYYREGALGALLDEYERAAGELKQTISGISQKDFVEVMDKETKDPDCVSIQSIMVHTINA